VYENVYGIFPYFGDVEKISNLCAPPLTMGLLTILGRVAGLIYKSEELYEAIALQMGGSFSALFGGFSH
jgi:hypothetical protein